MKKSQLLFTQAQQFIPAGVNSPVRAYRSVGGEPPFIQRGFGPYLIDADGNHYIDYVCSWGPLIVGHAHSYILEKVSAQLQQGVSFGAPTEVEVMLAKKVCELMPAIQMIRFVNSGTEAAMSAIRLARGYTKRNKIIKFIGCYHGHADSLLVAAGSGALTFGVPSSAGVPISVAQDTLVADYNNLDQVTALFDQYGDQIAAVIVEPIAGNMNLVLPRPGFLQGLRQLCDQYNSVLIFDEVITGFRVGLGGAQAYYDITPDLTLLGKIIGGGFPAAAFGGKAEIMHSIAPLGPVYQAGTLSGNPIAMAAGFATLELVSQANFYETLAQNTERLIKNLNTCANAFNIPFHAVSIGSMFGFFFTNVDKIETEADVRNCDRQLFREFFHGMLNNGVYLAPSAFEIGFVSAAHQESDFDNTLNAAEKTFASFKDKSCARSLRVQQG